MLLEVLATLLAVPGAAWSTIKLVGWFRNR